MRSSLMQLIISFMKRSLVVKTIFTCLFGMLVYQLLALFLREEPVESTRRVASSW